MKPPFTHEATGSDSRRSTHDAQKALFLHLRKCSRANKRVLKHDIAKCFDRISHKAILDEVIAPDFLTNGLRRCLKVGVDPKFPNQGTPQGGVCSPLLANIALNGIERIGEFRNRGITYSKCVRYADDMVFVLKPEDSAEKILAEVKEFLAKRGMEISQKKTKTTASKDGEVK